MYDKVVEMTGSFKAPMGCRSFLNPWTNEHGEEIHDGRNNLGVVSLNLPHVALTVGAGKIEDFWKELDTRLVIAHKALMARIRRFDNVQAKVAPILYMEGALGVRMKADDYVADLFKNGRASISLGYIGVFETVQALFGNDEHLNDSEVRRTFGIKIIQYLKDATDTWKEESGYAFSLYGTPSENLCHRFNRLNKEQFGLVAGVTDKDYITNSFHQDVRYKSNPYDKIDFEMPYISISNGGFITYSEFPNMRNNLDALEDVWDYAYDRVPYYGTNTPIDECYECGFKGEFSCTSDGYTCPQCGCHEEGKVSVTRRVCGYLGAPDARPFNAGKQEEVAKRVKHL